MTFLFEYVRHPLRTGTPSATQGAVARALAGGAGLDSARRVVELGAGTGAITGALADRLAPGAELLAVEVNPALARRLRRRCAAPNVDVVCASAVRLGELLRARRITSVDRVICTLPWTVMPVGQQRRILHAVREVLHDDGEFTTLLSAHRTRTRAGHQFGLLLHEHFPYIRQGSTFWMNVPPLRAYHCRQNGPGLADVERSRDGYPRA